MKSAILALGLAAALAGGGVAAAQPTHVMVRAQALDAKFIGDHVGGVRIVLRDARTGRVLARGLTRGGTGDTTRIMKTPVARGDHLADGSTAGFDAVLDLDRPTLVRAEATGPIGRPGSQIEVSSSLWVIPGRDVTGDGWVLSFPGLVVEPPRVRAEAAGLRVDAKVSPMCGCPIEPGGLWDAGGYTVEAFVLRGEQVVSRTPLAYAGSAGEFTGLAPAIGPAAPRGRLTLRLVATDARTPNAGVWEGPLPAR
ncbi:hypothetical protein ACO2Q3_01765 [Caulobacter sp. KR2-114]|uniref:hypothetical protein n=1 Tax=Caulobacter sp. KR2-114 TaxID=3400912 RepID=UPI003C017839